MRSTVKNITYGRWKQLKLYADIKETCLMKYNTIILRRSVLYFLLQSEGTKILNAPRLYICRALLWHQQHLKKMGVFVAAGGILVSIKSKMGFFFRVKVKVIDLGVIWKGFISWVCMPNMKSVSYAPAGTRGLKSRMYPPYPKRVLKGDLMGRFLGITYKKGGPVSVLGRAR